MNQKRFFSICLALVMALTLLTPAQAARTSFTDVADGDWYADAVAFCESRKLMDGTGDGQFSPNQTMTRAMAVTVLYRAAGSPDVSPDNGFSDVVPGAWYEVPVSWAARAGVASGYDYGAFGVSDPVTREQLATMLWRYSSSPDAPAGDDFANEADISGYAATAVDWAHAGGVMNGLPGNLFLPKGTATRAQLAQILMNYLQGAANRVTPSVLSELSVMCAPAGIAVTNDGALLVTDTHAKVIWRVKDGTSVVYAGTDSQEDQYGIPAGGYNDDDLDSSLFREPWAIAPFLDGWAVSDAEAGVVRLLRPTGTQTVNGHSSEKLTTGDMGVTFAYPTGLAADENGNLYVSDTHNGAVRKISDKGAVTTVAENLSDPMGLCWHEGALYVAETGANRIVKLSGSAVEVVAGSGQEDYLDGPALEAAFCGPQALAFGPDGTLYVADTANSAVRKVKDGTVSTVVLRDDEILNSLPVSPMGLAVKDGSLYICDNFARKVFAVPAV